MALGALLAATALSIPASSVSAVSTPFIIRLTIQGGIAMSIEPMTTSGAMRHVIEEFGRLLPAEVSANPAYVAKLSFGKGIDVPPQVTILERVLALKAAENLVINATTFSVARRNEEGSISLVGAYLPDNTVAAPGDYSGSATVQVLFQ